MLILLFLYLLTFGREVDAVPQTFSTPSEASSPATTTIEVPSIAGNVPTSAFIVTDSSGQQIISTLRDPSTVITVIAFSSTAATTGSTAAAASTSASGPTISTLGIAVGVSLGAVVCIITFFFYREIRASRRRNPDKRRRRLAELPANPSKRIFELFAGGFAWQAELEAPNKPQELPAMERLPELE